MQARDIRECNRLEKNAKRCDKARKVVELVTKSNELADLDLHWIIDKLSKASAAMLDVRRHIMKRSP